MSLPPVWYVLLLGVTVAAAPWILRQAADASRHRLALGVLVGLVFYEAGLIVLFYSKLACWVLVAVGVAAMATQAAPRRPALGAAVALPPAVVAGLAFQFLPDPRAFFVYFAMALPLLLASVLAAVLGRRGASRPRARSLLAAGAVLLFGAFTPASAFAFTFLHHYEVFHLPVLMACLAGLTYLARGEAIGARWRGDATLGERLAAPLAGDLRWAGLVSLAGLLVGFYPLLRAPFSGAWGVVAFVGWGAAMLVASWLVVRRPARTVGAWLLLGAAGAAALGAAAGMRFGAEAFQAFGGGPAPESLLFYLAGLGLAGLGFAATIAVARLVDSGRRSRLARQPERLVRVAPWRDVEAPAGFVVERVARLPGPRDLAAMRRRLKRSEASGGIVVVEEARRDPLEPMPEKVSRWLAHQAAGPRVHVAVREGREVFLVPWLDPEDEA